LNLFCVLFKPKQNAPAVKRYICFSQSLSIRCTFSAKPEAGGDAIRVTSS